MTQWLRMASFKIKVTAGRAVFYIKFQSHVSDVTHEWRISTQTCTCHTRSHEKLIKSLILFQIMHSYIKAWSKQWQSGQIEHYEKQEFENIQLLNQMEGSTWQNHDFKMKPDLKIWAWLWRRHYWVSISMTTSKSKDCCINEPLLNTQHAQKTRWLSQSW